MLWKKGVTLMEMIVILIIIGAVVAFALPNFTLPSEQARALTAQNNLLAIYTAEQNFNNNNNSQGYANIASLNLINKTLGLSIQDDGAYTYACLATPNTCTAIRQNPFKAVIITVTLNSPIVLTGASPNPVCTPLSNSYAGWCSY